MGRGPRGCGPWWRWRRPWPPRSAPRAESWQPRAAAPGRAADGRCAAMDGPSPPLSVWERELRTAAGAGERRGAGRRARRSSPRTSPIPCTTSRRSPSSCTSGGRAAASRTPGWRRPTARRRGRPRATRPSSGWPRCAAAAAAAAWSRRSCCTAGPGASCTWPGRPATPVFEPGRRRLRDRARRRRRRRDRADRAAGGGPPARLHRPADRPRQPPRRRHAARRGLERHRDGRRGRQPRRLRHQRPQAGQRHPRPRGRRPAAGAVRRRSCRCAARCCRARSPPGSAGTSSACWRWARPPTRWSASPDELCRRAAESGARRGRGLRGRLHRATRSGPSARPAGCSGSRTRPSTARRRRAPRSRWSRAATGPDDPVVRLADAAAGARRSERRRLPRARHAPPGAWTSRVGATRGPVADGRAVRDPGR